MFVREELSHHSHYEALTRRELTVRRVFGMVPNVSY